MRLLTLLGKTALLVGLLGTMASPGALAFSQALEDQAQRDGYENYTHYYCAFYGEHPMRNQTCPPEYMRRPLSSGAAAAGAGGAKNTCDVAWTECWNGAMRSPGYAGYGRGADMGHAAQCNAEKFRCYERLGVRP